MPVTLISWTEKRVDSIRRQVDELWATPIPKGRPTYCGIGGSRGYCSACMALEFAEAAQYWAAKGDRPRARRALRLAIARIAQGRIDRAPNPR